MLSARAVQQRQSEIGLFLRVGGNPLLEIRPFCPKCFDNVQEAIEHAKFETSKDIKEAQADLDSNVLARYPAR